MNREQNYQALLSNLHQVDYDELESKSIVAGGIMEAVETQLAEQDPAFVTEIFHSL